MTPPATLLRLHAGHTTLSDGAAPGVVIGIGAQALAERCFHHEPPTAIEIERAIDVVENALMATGLAHAVRGDLEVTDPLLLVPLGLAAGGRRTRDEVEARFERLAAAALGAPGAAADLPPGGAAALLLLRECMHHLGYAGVVHAQG